MKCTFCTESGPYHLHGSKIRCCERCWRLYRDNEWDALAAVWLASRPEDWVGDVAAYIEQSAPTYPVFNLTPASRYDVPADLVDMDPSDWLHD